MTQNQLTRRDLIAFVSVIAVIAVVFACLEWPAYRDKLRGIHNCSANPADSKRGTDQECTEYLARFHLRSEP